MDFDIAPLDRLNRISIVALVILTVAMLSMPLWYPLVTKEIVPGLIQLMLLLPGVIMLVALTVASGFAPRGYRLTETELVVRRRVFGSKTYHLSSFTAIDDGGKIFKRSHKLGGSAGFLGYYGGFRNKLWGNFEAQATDKDKGLILSGSKSLYISPAETQLFKDIFKAKLEGLSRHRGA